jgi:hypothetical protein
VLPIWLLVGAVAVVVSITVVVAAAVVSSQARYLSALEPRTRSQLVLAALAALVQLAPVVTVVIPSFLP